MLIFIISAFQSKVIQSKKNERYKTKKRLIFFTLSFVIARCALKKLPFPEGASLTQSETGFVRNEGVTDQEMDARGEEEKSEGGKSPPSCSLPV